MKVIMVSGPYRAACDYLVEENIAVAREVAAGCWRLGLGVVCPHLNSYRLGGLVDEQRFLDFYLELIQRHAVDALVLCPRWQASSGTRAEVDAAVLAGVQVFFYPNEYNRLRKWASDG